MGKKLLNILKYALLLAFSGALMVYALRGQDLSRIGQYLREANYFWLGLTMFASALGYFSRSYRWKMQLDAAGQKATFWDVYHASMVGNLANLVLPRMGEVIRCSVLRRSSAVPVQVALGTVVTERVIDVLVLALLLGSTLLLDFHKFWAFMVDKIFDGGSQVDALARNRTPLLIAAGIALVLLLIVTYALVRNLERLRQNALFNRLVVFVQGLLAGVFSIRRLEHKGAFLFHTFFTWLVYFLMDYLAFFAFPETYNLGWRAGIATLTFGAVGMAAPVSGGIGTFHLLVQSTLLVFGVSPEAGIAYALVVHGAQTLLVVLMGGISFVASMLKTGRSLRELAAEPLIEPVPADVE
ncbi:lysylphosphatidylglycerol synthase transmembrane domain-containing protein [Hymenobacter coalescens]